MNAIRGREPGMSSKYSQLPPKVNVVVFACPSGGSRYAVSHMADKEHREWFEDEKRRKEAQRKDKRPGRPANPEDERRDGGGAPPHGYDPVLGI